MRQSDWEAACHHTGTCGLTGSAAFFASIQGSGILINGPLWCYFYAMRHVEEVDPSAGMRFFCTEPDQNSLVYGTEQDILRAFDQVKPYPDLGRLFIENNCSVGMVGDDINGIIGKSDAPWPVYAMDSGGLQGSFEGGFSKAFFRVLEEMKELPMREGTVNVFGLTDVSLKGEEDREEIKRILSLAGYEVLATPGSGCTWEQLMQVPAAEYNIVVRDELGLSPAREAETRFGTPYLSVGLPYGIGGTVQWLEHIVESIDGGNMDLVREEADERDKRMSHRINGLQSMWGPLWFDQVLVIAPPSEAAGIAEAFRSEWGDTANLIVHFTCATEKCPEAANAVRIVGQDDVDIKRDYEEWEDGLVLASSHEVSRLIRLGKTCAYSHIARPAYDEFCLADGPFCGLRGAAYLYERIGNASLRKRMERNVMHRDEGRMKL